MNATLKHAIEQLVNAVPTDNLFDTHVVIEQLIDQHRPFYDSFVHGRDLNNAHAEISCVVRDSGLVTRSKNQSFSRTVNGTYDSVACWLRK